MNKPENVFLKEGGVTYPQGFKASGIHCGLRKNKSKRDLALIYSDTDCAASAVYTQNKVFGAPIAVTRENLKNGRARAVICNSGIANTCNPDGIEKAHATCKALADALGIQKDDIIVASTGVIGMPLPLEPILGGLEQLKSELDSTPEAGENAAIAIMTTDTRKKEYAVSVTVGGKEIRLGGIAKGSGMIQPNMATMLGFLTTDAAISPAMLEKALKAAIRLSFNMVSVDGDTSTNDMVSIMASGLAGNAEIASVGEDYDAFYSALLFLCTVMSRAIAADGEGASKLLECKVQNFTDEAGARLLAKSVINSSLVKTAMFGADANWGRILCALGYAGVDFDPGRVDVSFSSSAGSIAVCKNGGNIIVDEAKAKEILVRDEIIIDINMNCGTTGAAAWGCDLSYEYVRINGDYRS